MPLRIHDALRLTFFGLAISSPALTVILVCQRWRWNERGSQKYKSVPQTCPNNADICNRSTTFSWLDAASK